MAKVSIYLNFPRTTEQAFNFYKTVFKTEFSVPFMRMGEMPPQEGMPEFTDEEKQKIMHVALPILTGIEIMGTDTLESMGHYTVIGNNTTINLEPDSKEETVRLFELLSEGATEIAPLHDQFWGALWGCCLDKYGIRWMFNYAEQKG